MTFSARTILFRWFDEVWNQQRTETIDELMAPHCLTTVQGADAPLTRDAFKDYHRAFLSAVPDLRSDVLDVITDGIRSTASWRARGTHLGPGLGIPPSRRPVDFSGLSLFEFDQGLIVRGFDSWNRGEMIASLMQVRMDELRRRLGLTRREAQVALMMSERLTYREIADQLHLQPNTVRRYCERVLSKLGIHSRRHVPRALGKVTGSILNRHGEDLIQGAS